jgi:hypothetical protein
MIKLIILWARLSAMITLNKHGDSGNSLNKPSNLDCVLPTRVPVLSQFSLAEKNALYRGCRNIGLRAVRRLAEAGANVALTYTSTPSIESR